MTHTAEKKKLALITGGAGFIGTNLADRILSTGKDVIIFDNLSRVGTEHNVLWLKRKYGQRIHFRIEDIRSRHSIKDALEGVDQVFHLAAQVAVTTSLDDPIEDFEINLSGTLNLLEAVRAMKEKPSLLFTSTNKVYGNLNDLVFLENCTRYEPADEFIKNNGISERRNLDFHSPYGCSKGSADQYILDYCRIYDLPTIVFRMSCIYGPHQFGTEDQGWVAHFLIRSMNKNNITIYGDGKQVRDILFIDDLTQAMLLAVNNLPKTKGRVFNIGGGPDNTISITELLEQMEILNGFKPQISFGPWRSGDQKYYVSDTSSFRNLTGWQPKTNTSTGIEKLYLWLKRNSSRPRERLQQQVAL
jgi:CDP-paratose 2-epimerase